MGVTMPKEVIVVPPVVDNGHIKQGPRILYIDGRERYWTAEALAILLEQHRPGIERFTHPTFRRAKNRRFFTDQEGRPRGTGNIEKLIRNQYELLNEYGIKDTVLAQDVPTRVHGFDKKRGIGFLKGIYGHIAVHYNNIIGKGKLEPREPVLCDIVLNSIAPIANGLYGVNIRPHTHDEDLTYHPVHRPQEPFSHQPPRMIRRRR